MSYTSLPTVTAGDFIRASWATLVDGNFDDHESRIVTLEGGASSVQTLTNKTLDAEGTGNLITIPFTVFWPAAVCDCLLYTSDAADERSSVDLGGRRIIKKK